MDSTFDGRLNVVEPASWLQDVGFEVGRDMARTEGRLRELTALIAVADRNRLGREGKVAGSDAARLSGEAIGFPRNVGRKIGVHHQSGAAG